MFVQHVKIIKFKKTSSSLEKFIIQYSFLILGVCLSFIGTLFFFKKYEEGENAGKILGAFWLFIGILITTIIIQNL